MGLRAWLSRRPVEAASLAATAPARTFALDWQQFPWWQERTEGGRVTRDYALEVPAVLKARNIVVGTIAALPIQVLDPDNNVVRSPLLEQIDPDVANPVTVASLVEDVIFEGIGWLQVLGRDGADFPVWARRIDPSVVSAQPPPGTILADLPSGYVPGSTLWVAGIPVSSRDMIRFDSPNPPLLVAGARAIRRAAKYETAAEMFAGNPMMRGYFSPSEGQDPDQADIEATLDDWESRRRERVDGYVPAALTWNQVEVMSPADIQLATLIDKATIGIANAFGVDSEDLSVSTTSRTYANAVDRRQDKINETYGPIVAAIGARLSMADVTRRGQRVCFSWDRFLEPNPTDRAAIASSYLASKVITTDEVRADEGRPALTAAQREELHPAPPPQLIQPQSDQSAGLATVTDLNAHARRAVGFAGEPGLVFDCDVSNAFSVDENRRTITGLVMPWGEIGRSGGAKWRFTKDSLKFSKAQANRIKLLVDHDTNQSVGRLERTWSDEVGQWATFKVARGPEGDRALAMAADGARDGLSAGVGYHGDSAGFNYSDDPAEPGVRLVTAAPWRETSLVALPAFASARTTAVTMAADNEGTDMPETGTQSPEAAPVAGVTYTAEQVAAMFAALKPAPAVAPTEPERPAVVNPTALPLPVSQVAEAPLYRFDGGKGQRNFTADIANGFGGDSELRHKAETFIAEHMGAAFANIASSAVSTLNPAVQRPDLYVPNLYFSRPIGSMVTGGVVSEITRQTLPKFSASSGLAATHTEGTEPTDGAFSTTSQNVDPRAISGRVTVNREVVDQGGTPQTDQLIWNEMTQFYAKLLETRLVDSLQALSISDTAVVGADDGLQDALLTLFAGFQFIAGGDRYRGLALHQDLYTAIISAVDGDGRALFPMLNATNAAGTTASDWSNVRVGSKVGVPAWALASGNGGPDKSFLFAPESVYQWFSPPRRIDLDRITVATVGIGIWGYSAEFVTRNSDVIQLAYTAS